MGHPTFRNDAEAMAFAWLVLRASWKPCAVRYKERQISLLRGQLALSIRDFAKAMDRDKGWAERLLKRLATRDMAKTDGKTGVLVITICNYERYQAIKDTGKTPSETKPKTGARQGQDTEQEREEGKKGRSVATATLRAIDFPRPDWADEQVWRDFMANRKKKRATNSRTAYRGFLADIARLTDDDWPPPRLLEHAVAHGWAGIYEPNERTGNGRTNGMGGHKSRDGLSPTTRAANRVFGAPGFGGDIPQ